MRLVERAIGNIHGEALWRQRFERAKEQRLLETVVLNPWETQKRRLRVTTDTGSDLGIALAFGEGLTDGSVLEYEQDSGALTVVRVAGHRLLVLLVEGEEPEVVAARALRLGHLLGNQHWPARVQGRRVDVPLQIDERVVRTVLETYLLDGVRYEFVDAETIPEPNLATDPSHRHA